MTASIAAGVGLGADAPCSTRKIRYVTAADADAQMVEARALRATGVGNGHVERRPYWCNLCAGWHLTSEGYGKPRKGKNGRGLRGR